MKLEVDEDREVVLKEVYNTVWFETSEGNSLGVCMRDDTFELVILSPEGHREDFRVNMQKMTIS